MNNLENQDLPATPLQGFTAIESFIRAFLRCDDHQLAILALWIANTWCFSRFLTIPYLDVRSPEPQCGKSVCIKLLELLSFEPALVTAADPGTLFHIHTNGEVTRAIISVIFSVPLESLAVI